MITEHPKKIIAIGFVLVLFGFIGPFLMVLKILESSFVLNFLSYGASISGLMLGVIGSATYFRMNKSRTEGMEKGEHSEHM